MGIDPAPALIIVDVQRDFCPGGSLAVSRGDEVVPVLNRYIQFFSRYNYPCMATRDWHCAKHCSFKEQGGPWPPHCIQNTRGAQFHADLKMSPAVRVFSKAQAQDRDAYSGFEGTGLERFLHELDATSIYVGGLATDYCVKHTVLDGLKAGFRTHLLADAIRGVDAKPGDSERAIQEMLQKGALSAVWADLAT